MKAVHGFTGYSTHTGRATGDRFTGTGTIPAHGDISCFQKHAFDGRYDLIRGNRMLQHAGGLHAPGANRRPFVDQEFLRDTIKNRREVA